MQGTSSYWGSKRWTDLTASDDLNLDATDDETTIQYWPHPVYVTGCLIMATAGSNIDNTTGPVTVHIFKDSNADGTEDATALGEFNIGTGDFTYDTDSPVYVSFVLADTDGTVAVDNATTYAGPAGPVFVDVGEGFLLKMDASDVADGTSVARVAFEYIPLPPANSAHTYVEVVATPPVA